MTTILLWLAIVVLTVGIVRLARGQMRLAKTLAANAEVTAQLATQLAATSKTLANITAAQGGFNEAVMRIVGLPVPPQTPPRTKPHLTVVHPSDGAA